MNDEELKMQTFRLECLKLAHSLHYVHHGLGSDIDIHNANIPRYVMLEADKYMTYIKEGNIPALINAI